MTPTFVSLSSVVTGLLLVASVPAIADSVVVAHEAASTDRIVLDGSSLGGQTRLSSRVWLAAGLGIARTQLSLDNRLARAFDDVSTIDRAVGLDAVRTRNLGLDLDLRGSSGLSADDVRGYNAALGLGVSWF